MSVQMRLSQEELKVLAEMTSLALAIAEEGDDANGLSPSDLDAWDNVFQKIMEQAHKEPGLKKLIDFPDEEGGYSFKRDYEENAFYVKCLEEFRDTMFWNELVTRMADKAIIEHIGQESFDSMTEEACRRMTEPMEKALWKECTKHGLDRFGFVIPPLEG